jgi:uncharacterized oxidoreductase
MKLKGNTIVITGGTSGIGRELVERFVGLGNSVITCGRRKERLEELKARFPALAVFPCDVNAEGERKGFADWVAKNHPLANVLVNNAGIQLVGDLTRPSDSARAPTAACRWRISRSKCSRRLRRIATRRRSDRRRT